MTGDKVEKDEMVMGKLTDFQMASKVRMLMRWDLDHEFVCTGARDRIMYLSQECDRLTSSLAEKEKEVERLKSRNYHAHNCEQAAAGDNYSNVRCTCGADDDMGTLLSEVRATSRAEGIKEGRRQMKEEVTTAMFVADASYREYGESWYDAVDAIAAIPLDPPEVTK